jgi:hypothetical protein
MNLTEYKIRFVLFIGLIVEWKSGTLHLIIEIYYLSSIYKYLHDINTESNSLQPY